MNFKAGKLGILDLEKSNDVEESAPDALETARTEHGEHRISTKRWDHLEAARLVKQTQSTLFDLKCQENMQDVCKLKYEICY